MRALNYAANLLLAKIVSRVAQRSVDDSLCGTKVLWRDDWHEIESRFPDLLGIDPFGDYSIIFGAAAIRRQILSVPTVYRARTYGETNILRFRDGLKLLRVISAWHRELQKQSKCYLSY